MRCEVVSKDGYVEGTFDSAKEALEWAQANMPGEQDTGDEPEPTGWDIQRARQ